MKFNRSLSLALCLSLCGSAAFAGETKNGQENWKSKISKFLHQNNNNLVESAMAVGGSCAIGAALGGPLGCAIGGTAALSAACGGTANVCQNLSATNQDFCGPGGNGGGGIYESKYSGSFCDPQVPICTYGDQQCVPQTKVKSLVLKIHVNKRSEPYANGAINFGFGYSDGSNQALNADEGNPFGPWDSINSNYAWGTKPDVQLDANGNAVVTSGPDTKKQIQLSPWLNAPGSKLFAPGIQGDQANPTYCYNPPGRSISADADKNRAGFNVWNLELVDPVSGDGINPTSSTMNFDSSTATLTMNIVFDL